MWKDQEPQTWPTERWPRTRRGKQSPQTQQEAGRWPWPKQPRQTAQAQPPRQALHWHRPAPCCQYNGRRGDQTLPFPKITEACRQWEDRSCPEKLRLGSGDVLSPQQTSDARFLLCPLPLQCKCTRCSSHLPHGTTATPSGLGTRGRTFGTHLPLAAGAREGRQRDSHPPGGNPGPNTPQPAKNADLKNRQPGCTHSQLSGHASSTEGQADALFPCPSSPRWGSPGTTRKTRGGSHAGCRRRLCCCRRLQGSL